MPAYTTAATVKAALGITTTTQDANVGLAITSASRLIDRWCRRTFGAGASDVREYAADGPGLISIDDVATSTAFQLETRGSVGSTWTVVTATDYQLIPLNQMRNGVAWAYTHVRATDGVTFPSAGEDALIRVTASFGWPAVPEEIEQACLIQACRLLKRPESAMGVLGVTDVGAITVTKGLDTDVALLIEDYRRIGGI